MHETSTLHLATIPWLFENKDPSLRYLAQRELHNLPGNDPDLMIAQKEAHQNGPIKEILDQMHPDGWWVDPGAGYTPKYRSTVWSLILLAQLGASAALDERIATACRYYLDHAFCDQGQIGLSGSPSSTADCLQGNMLSTFLDLGFYDPRMDQAFDWMARSVTGEGIAALGDKKAPLRYYAGKCGPTFACGANNKQPCAWGAVKVMLAFGKLAEAKRTPLIEQAIQQGAAFLLGVDPATAAYPNGWAEKPSGNWWKFGFPVFYVTDLLQLVEALIRTGYGTDTRLTNALQLIREKQDAQGCWNLEYDYKGKTWLDFGEKKQPNAWVTYRAAWVLMMSGI
jgi:hypothetical protein